MKKILALVLAVLMLLSALPFGVLAEELASAETPEAMVSEAVVPEVPSASAEEDVPAVDPIPEIPAETNGEEVAASPLEDDRAQNTDSPIAKIEFAGTRKLFENDDCYQSSSWDSATGEYVYWTRYNLSTPAYTITFKDGTVVSGSAGSGFNYQNNWYFFSCSSDQSYENQWVVGGTYTATAKVLGFETTFRVEIVETPIEKIEFEGAKKLFENDNCYQSSHWDSATGTYVNWNQYNLSAPAYTITLKDGTVISGSAGNSFNYQNNWYSFSCSSDQSYENQWVAGGTYTATAEVLGFETTFQVEIVETPIEKIEFEGTKKIIEGYNCSQNSYWDSATGTYVYWNRYYLYTPAYKITMKDGTVISGSAECGFYYQNQYYSFSCTSDQSYQNQWVAGGNYTVTAEALGFETTFQVEVVKTPIAKIEPVSPIKVAEGIDCRKENYWDSATGQNMTWFRYELSSFSIDVTMLDGSVQRLSFSQYSSTSLRYEGGSYSVTRSLDQSYENQWAVGGTYSVKLSVLGFETELPVKVEETPVEKLEFHQKRIVLFENDEGTVTENGFLYQYSAPAFTCVLKNGETLEVDYSLYYEGKYHYVSTSDTQEQSPWGIGVHTVTVTFMGCSATFEVEVRESPVERVEFDPIVHYEGTGGFFITGTGQNNVTIEKGYEYNVRPESLTVVLKDGIRLDSLKMDYDYSTYGRLYVVYEGQEFNVSITSDQSETNLWGVGTHKAKLEIMGYSAEYEVEILPCPYQSIEILQIEDVREYIDKDWNDVYYIPKFSYRVIAKDGSVSEHVYPGSIEYYYQNSELTSLWVEEGDALNWEPGKKNTFTIKYSGLTLEVPVNLIPNGGFRYLEQNGEMFAVGFYDEEATELVLPAEYEGKPVVGIMRTIDDYTWYTWSLENVERIVIPDTIRYICDDFIPDAPKCKTVTIGKGVTSLPEDMFFYFDALESIEVSPENEMYSSKDGVLYNKAGDTLVAYPRAKGNEYVVSAGVVDIDVIKGIEYKGISVSFDPDQTDFITLEGVTYTADMTRVVFCSSEKAGEYEMPQTVTTINKSAFLGCRFLTKVKVSKNVTSIAYSAFRGCTSLKSVSLPAGIKSIEKWAFESCESLESIVLPEGLDSIGKGAFQYCSSLSAVAIPDTVTEMGPDAFYQCEKLSELSIGKGLAEIPSWSFAYSALDRVILPENVKIVGSYSFCDAPIKNLVAEGVLDVIGNGAFTGAQISNLDSVEGVKKIGDGAFRGTLIKEVVLPASVTELVYHPFDFGTKIDLPEGLISIDYAPSDHTDVYGFSYCEHVLLGYGVISSPSDSVPVVKSGTRVIADHGFAHYPLAGITLSEEMTHIGNAAFEASKLESITIPASVVRIGNGAFQNCTRLRRIDVDPDNPNYSSKDGVLYNKDGTELIWCPNLGVRSFAIPETVKKIHSYAFGDSGISYVFIENDDLELAHGAFGLSCRYMSQEDEKVYEEDELIRLVCSEGSTAFEYAKNYPVHVFAVEETGIRIAALPDQTDYGVGESVSLAGLKVEKAYGNEGVLLTEGYTVSEADTTTVGTKTLTVTYGEYRTSFEIRVLPVLSLETKKAKVGDEVELTLSLSGSPELKGILIDGLTYDASLLEPVSAAWLGEYADVSWDLTTLSSTLLATQGAELNGAIAKVRFRVKGGAEGDMLSVGVKAEVLTATGENLPVRGMDGNVMVITYVSGDLNEDGLVNEDDALYLLYHAFFPARYPVSQPVDFDGNGGISSDDAIYLLYHVFFPNRYPL